MRQVHGLLETSLYVSDVSKAADFYRRLFQFSTLLESERLIALNVVGKSVLLLFKQGATTEPFESAGGVIPGHGSTGPSHLAFAIGKEDVADWRERLQAEGVAVESEVKWQEGARSLYFRDPDGHLVELITTGFWAIY